MKNPLTPAGIEPVTFRFSSQDLNHCATAVTQINKIYIIYIFHGSTSLGGLSLHMRVPDRTQTQHVWQNLSRSVIGPSQSYSPDNTQQTRRTSTPSAGIEPAFPPSGRPQTHALDRVATGIDSWQFISLQFWELQNLKHPISLSQSVPTYHTARRHTSDVSNLRKPFCVQWGRSQHFRPSEAGALYRSSNDVCPTAAREV